MSDPTVHCPTCQKPIIWNDTAIWRPFCSERCKIIDLGDWASEKHRVAGEPAPSHDADSEPNYH